MKVFKVELMIVDYDNIGHDEIRDVLENVKYPNHCISPTVTNIDWRDIGDWHDDHPLNKRNADAFFRGLFND